MRLLIDTNILIPLYPETEDDLTSASTPIAQIKRVAAEKGWRLLLSEAQLHDIYRDNSDSRRNLRVHYFESYQKISLLGTLPNDIQTTFGNPSVHSNDWVDAHLALCLQRGQCDVLITQDRQLTKRCSRLGLESRVWSLLEAQEHILPYLIPGESQSGNVELRKAAQVNTQDPIFESLREDYDGFDAWFQKCCDENRDVFVVQQDEHLAGLAVLSVKHSPLSSEEARLKICTFKVSPRYSGYRIGELLLSEIFRYMSKKSISNCYLTVFPRHDVLIGFLRNFGFESVKLLDSSELKMVKQLRIFSAENNGLLNYEDFIKYGPYNIVTGGKSYIFPIRPQYHDLFYPSQMEQLSLIPELEPASNSLRKAYVTQSSHTLPQKGDLLWLYRSERNQGITGVTVVESSQRFNEPYSAFSAIRGRTVYLLSDLH
ncbi:MAG: GNAT family N-acetyltransferase [Fimbriimonadaceae bacterium]